MLSPLTLQRMEAASGDAPIVVALSGGGDSVALLHLLAERFGAHRLRAAIVDHALRAGSADDARRALDFAAAIGVQGEVLTLSWDANANRAQQAARLARYRALCAFARERKARVIALGHTADDQAETVLMRAAAGSGWRGLAGIAPLAPAPVWPEGQGLLLARPLLGARRSALRDALRARRAAWIDDPANENEAYERVRARRTLSALAEAGFDAMRLPALAARLRSPAERVDAAASELIANAATLDTPIRIARQRWCGAAEVRARALQVLMAAASGAARSPQIAALAEIEARILALGHRGSTHSGVLFARQGQDLVLSRDPGAVLGRAGAPALAPLPLPVGEEVIWDGRLGLTAKAPGWAALPADNADLIVFSDGAQRLRAGAASDIVHIRALAAERVQHAFSAIVNRP